MLCVLVPPWFQFGAVSVQDTAPQSVNWAGGCFLQSFTFAAFSLSLYILFLIDFKDHSEQHARVLKQLPWPIPPVNPVYC